MDHSTPSQAQANADERRKQMFEAVQTIYADEGEVLTGFVIMSEWDTGQRQYPSRMSGDGLGRPLALHRIDGLLAHAEEHERWVLCGCPACVADREEEDE